MVVCEECGYEWDYRGEMVNATCPSCQSKTKTEEAEVIVIEPDEVPDEFIDVVEELRDELED